jgi:hypothetical protein
MSFFLDSPKRLLFFSLQPIIPIHDVIYGLVLVAHGPVAGRYQHLPKEAGHSTHKKKGVRVKADAKRR